MKEAWKTAMVLHPGPEGAEGDARNVTDMLNMMMVSHTGNFAFSYSPSRTHSLSLSLPLSLSLSLSLSLR